MKKSIVKNYIYNLTYQILILILPLITIPYISRVLGAENIGIYSYTLSITAFFILFGSLGTALYGQREIAFVQEEKNKYSRLFWEIEILRVITMGISLIIYYFTFAVNGEYGIYYKILIVEVIANCIDINWFFQGVEEFKKTVIRNTIIKIISVACIFIFVKTKDDLIKYFIIYILSLFLGNLSLWLYLPKYLNKVKFRELDIIKHIKPTINLFIPQIAIQIYTILDKAMIGSIITDKSEVGYYEQSQKIIKLLLTVEGAFGTVMMPRIACSFAQKDNGNVKNSLKKSFSMAYILAFPMLFGIIAVADIFVPIYFGQGYEKVSTLMKIISPIILFIGISGCIGHQYLLPTKRQKEYTISVILGAVINLISNSLLIWKYGAIGASIGTVVAELSVALCQIIMVRNEIEIFKMLKLSKNYLISSMTMFLVCFIIQACAGKINTLVILILQIIAGIITYGMVLLILKDDFSKQIIEKIISKVKRN